MTVKELIERLEDEGPEAEVRFVYQASYPLQDDIKGVWAANGEATCPNGDEHELQDHYELGQRVEGKRWCVDCQLVYEDDELEQPDKHNKGVVFIVSDGQHYDMPYGPRAAFAETS